MYGYRCGLKLNNSGGQFYEALRFTKTGLFDYCIQQMHVLVGKSSFSKAQGLHEIGSRSSVCTTAEGCLVSVAVCSVEVYIRPGAIYVTALLLSLKTNTVHLHIKLLNGDHGNQTF